MANGDFEGANYLLLFGKSCVKFYYRKKIKDETAVGGQAASRC